MKVFVYGTLKKGFGNHFLLKDSQFIKVDKVSGLMYNIGPFPGAVPAKGDNPLHGEIYEIDETTLQRLDRLEGVPHLYRRETEKTSSGEEVFIYWFNGHTEGRPIFGGIWK